MKKFTLSIPKPCHENWENMTPEEKGRFCGACQKTVVDFTNMSDREIAQFFKKKSASVCGRFQQDQLDRVIDVPRKRMPFIKELLTISLPAMFLANRAHAQGEVRREILGKVMPSAVCQRPVKGDTVISPQPELKEFWTISGKVVDEKGTPIRFATIKIKNTSVATQSNNEGNFQLNLPKEKSKEIEVSAPGYAAKTVIVSHEHITIALLPLPRFFLGEVFIADPNEKKKSPVIQPEEFTVKGKVVDENGEPIASASVFFKGTSVGTQTDNKGSFQLKQLETEEKEIIVSAIGYEAKTLMVTNDSITIMLPTIPIKREVIVVGFTVKRKSPVVPLIEQKKKNAPVPKFSIYPNPVAPNTTFTLDAKTLEQGAYRLAVINSAGAQVQTEEIVIDTKMKQSTIEVGNLMAGFYFVQLTNKKSGKSYTETIVVQ